MNRTRAVVVGAGGALILGLAAGAVGLAVAQQRADEAAGTYAAAAADRREAMADLSVAEVELASTAVDAAPVLGVARDSAALASDGVVPAPELSALAAAVTRLDSLLERAGAPAESLPRSPGPRPDDLEALVDETEQLEADAATASGTATEVEELASEVERAEQEVAEAGQGVLDALPGAAATVLESNAGATTAPRVALRALIPELESAQWGPTATDVIARFVSSAQAVVASKAAEDAEKAGPLYPARMEVEAFAQSISGGVLLDFDWAPVVNGFGSGGSYGGTSTWDPAGTSTITLSDSVADLWDDNPAVASLVVHEVGHSITSKCLDLYRGPFGSQDELWATAWAIGMGYRGDGNGESLYGTPSDYLIAASAQCR